METLPVHIGHETSQMSVVDRMLLRLQVQKNIRDLRHALTSDFGGILYFLYDIQKEEHKKIAKLRDTIMDLLYDEHLFEEIEGSNEYEIRKKIEDLKGEIRTYLKFISLELEKLKPYIVSPEQKESFQVLEESMDQIVYERIGKPKKSEKPEEFKDPLFPEWAQEKMDRRIALSEK